MLNYTSFINSFATVLVATTTDVNFATVVPDAIDYAELRCYRDLDLLNTVVTATSTLTAGSRIFALPSTSGTFVVTEQINVITPASAMTADSGTRNPLTPGARELLDVLFPSVSGSTIPNRFALLNQTTALLGPWPDQSYVAEVVGTIRPLALSSSNVTTILTVWFPDLFLAAALIWGFGYQRDFGAQTDDPQAGNNWERQYQTLLKSAQVEEMRKKFSSEAWSAKTVDPLPQPPRA